MGEQQFVCYWPTQLHYGVFLGKNRKIAGLVNERNNEIILGSEVLCAIQVLAGFVGVDSGKRCCWRRGFQRAEADLRWSLHSC